MIQKLWFYFFLFSLSVSGQENKKLALIFSNYPENLSSIGLANRIANDFSSDKERAKAAFFWVANTIKYNLFAYKDPKAKVIGFSYFNEEDKRKKISAIQDSIVQHTLETKKAVCEGYARTLSKIYTHLKLENIVVKGFVRNSIHDIGKQQKMSNHIWNIVKIDNEWKIVDATWAAGSVSNGTWKQTYDDYYYDIPRNHYLKTHFPENSRWKFGNKISKAEFYNQPIYSSEFLKTNFELIQPIYGIVKKSKTKEFTLKIKNLTPIESVFYAISTSKYAQKPDITYKNNVSYIKIKSFKKSNYLFLLMNNQVYLEFKLM